MQPGAVMTGGLQVSLHNGVGGVLPLDGTTHNFVTTAPSQRAYFTFQAAQNDDIAVALHDIVVTPADALYVNIYRPDGGSLYGGYCWDPPNGCEYGFRKLPQTGTYSMTVEPYASNQRTMNFNVSVVAGRHRHDGLCHPHPLSTTATGQNALITFTVGTTGNYAIGLSNVSTLPANQDVRLLVYNLGELRGGGQRHHEDERHPRTERTCCRHLRGDGVSGAARAKLNAELVLQPGAQYDVAIDGTPTTVSSHIPGQAITLNIPVAYLQSFGAAFSGLSPAVRRRHAGEDNPVQSVLERGVDDLLHVWRRQLRPELSGHEHEWRVQDGDLPAGAGDDELHGQLVTEREGDAHGEHAVHAEPAVYGSGSDAHDRSAQTQKTVTINLTGVSTSPSNADL